MKKWDKIIGPSNKYVSVTYCTLSVIIPTFADNEIFTKKLYISDQMNKYEIVQYNAFSTAYLF